MTFVAVKTCKLLLLTTISLIFQTEASSLIRGASDLYMMSG